MASEDLAAFFSGLGTGDPGQVKDPDALFHDAGALLRVLTAGLTATMMTRASFKSELRLGVTTIRRAENNPFKFSVSPEEALERLLLRPNPAYLPPLDAAREAFEDIQAHEMAMIAGLRAGGPPGGSIRARQTAAHGAKVTLLGPVHANLRAGRRGRNGGLHATLRRGIRTRLRRPGSAPGPGPRAAPARLNRPGRPQRALTPHPAQARAGTYENIGSTSPAHRRVTGRGHTDRNGWLRQQAPEGGQATAGPPPGTPGRRDRSGQRQSRARGSALPIVVRVFELKAQGAFGGADFFSLYEHESKTLGGELIAREELTLAPGQTRQIVKPLDPQTRYLGVLGAFREIDRATWRALVPLVAGKDNNLDVAVDANAIRVQPH